MLTGEQRRTYVEEMAELQEVALILLEGLDDAILGVGWRYGTPATVYDRAKILEILCDRDGMNEVDAVEFFQYNIDPMWVGEHTPIFLDRVLEPLDV